MYSVGSDPNQETKIIFDTAATVSIFRSRELFAELKEMKVPVQLKLISGAVIEARLSGTVGIQT